MADDVVVGTELLRVYLRTPAARTGGAAAIDYSVVGSEEGGEFDGRGVDEVPREEGDAQVLEGSDVAGFGT